MALRTMPKTPDFEPVQVGDRWMISIPPSMSGDGKRHRRTFSTETAAKVFGAKMRGSHAAGHRGSVIPLKIAMQAQEAMGILEGTGISLPEAARMVVANISAENGAELFRDRFARVTEANQDRWSDTYRIQMGRLDRYVPGWFMDMPCGAITREVMERALREKGSKSRSTLDLRCRYLSAVIGFRERHHKGTDISILSLADCGKLLRACESPAERRAVALLLFAGVRPDTEHGEIARLDWSAVGKSEIYLSREVSKVGDRHIPITGRLGRLLRGHPSSGPVVPPNWRRVYKRIRAAVPEIHGKQDVMRHTFASHFLAAFGEDACKAAMGHTAGSRTLFRHYRVSVTGDAGKRYFR